MSNDSAQDHREFIEQMPNGYALHEIICDEEGLPIDYRFLEVNPAFERITGLKADAVVGRTVLEVLPQTEQTWIQRFGKVALTGESTHFEDYSQQLYQYFEVTALCPAPRRFACLFTDITDRKRAEEVLIQSEKRLQNYLIASPSAITVYRLHEDDRLVLTRVNPAAERMAGADGASLVGKSIEEAFPSVVGTAIPDMYRSLARDEIGTQVYEVHYEDTRLSGWYKVSVFNIGANEIGVEAFDITERRRAKEALQESEERWRRAIASSPIPIMIHDEDDNVLQLSEGWTDFSGYVIEDIPKVTDWTERAYGERTGTKKAYIDELFSIDKTVDNGEWEIRAKDGSKRNWSFKTTPLGILNKGKRVLHSMALDITESKQAEVTLHQRTQLLEATQSIAQVGGWELDLATGELFWTAETYRIHDTSPEEFNPTVDAGVGYFLPESGRTISAAIEAAMARGEGYDLVLETLTTKGRRIDVRTTCEVTMDEGRATKLTGTFQDITQRKQAELALAAEKERLAVTLRSIGDGVITTDTDGEIVMLNKAAEALTGWTSDDAAGRPMPEVFNIIDERTREPCETPVAGVLATGEIVEMPDHTHLIVKDGRDVLIACSGAPIHDNANRVIGAVVVFRDMTEKRSLEDFMRKSQKLKSLGVLAGGIAHDFNNLLTSIFGNLEMAFEDTTQESVSAFLAESLSNIGRARALTQQLLTFARGGEPIKKVDSLFPFVRNSAQFVLSGSSISSVFTVPDGLWSCNFDRNQVGQVIDNLTINAQQAMPDGGTIDIQAVNIALSEKEHLSLVAGNYVKLSIKDQGKGIPREHLPRIFDPYYSTKPDGHGLGLATCYSIIDRHGGCIDVDSELGRGTIVHVYLPASMQTVSLKTERSLGRHAGSGTFLVMDDDEAIRKLMTRMLASFGYTVVVKEDGQDAVDFFRSEFLAKRRVAGVLFDLTVPGGMGGREAIAGLRKICPDTPAFVASGYSGDPIMASPEKFGFNASIRKPCMMAELSEMLDRHLIGDG